MAETPYLTRMIIERGLADKPSPRQKSGHVFREWYAEDGLTNVWDFDGDTVNSYNAVRQMGQSFAS